MRIAHVMLAKKFGGAERSFVDLVLALAARGHEVLAIGEARGVALDHLRGAAGIETREVRCYGSWDRLAEQHIRRELARFAPAVVHAHLARAAHLGGRAAHALGLPTVAKTHNLVNLKYYHYIDVLVPTTQAQADYLAARGTGAALQRIPNFSRIEAVTAVPNPPAPPYRIAALGRFVHKKGFDVLIEACGYLVDAGIDLVLDLGGDGHELGALTRAISRHGLEGRVRLRGWIDDVSGFLDGAHLFVLPSRDEPFGIVLLEAMARGVPIVATRTQGPREILDAELAWLVDAEDPAALAAAMRVALTPGERSERAARALARFHASYSEAPVVGAYLDLYTRLGR